MSGNFKQTFPASLLQSFIIIKAMVIRCLNFPMSISHERVLSKMFNQKIKCNIIPGRNGLLSAQKKITLSSTINSLILFFFFFPLPLTTSNFFLVSFPYFFSACRPSEDEGGQLVPTPYGSLKATAVGLSGAQFPLAPFCS